MGAAEAILKVKLLFDDSDAKKGLEGSAKAVEDTGKSWQKTAAAFASAAITGKIVEFGKASVAAAGENAKAQKTLKAVFKATGDTTGEAAKAAIDYATALQHKTGIDDETIMSSQALLASFANVSSETARQAGIFDRATAAAADLAAAGFGSMETNAKLLGKALQDPAKGMMALNRIGVVFTQTQQDQIKAMMKSGDVLGAQKLILQQVEGQVGGTAAATASSGAIMKQTFEDMQEAIGKKLLPVVVNLKKMLTELFKFIEQHSTVFTLLAVAVTIVTAAFALATIGLKIYTIATTTAVGATFWWIAAIMAIVVAIIWLWNNCEWFRNAVTAIWNAIVAVFNWAKAVILPVLQAIWNGFVTAWNAIYNVVNTVVKAIGTAIGWLVSTFGSKFAAVANIIKSYAAVWFLPVQIAFDLLKAIVSGDWDKVLAIFKGIPGRVASALGGLIGALTAPFRNAFDAVKGIIQDAINWIQSKMASIGAVIQGAINVAKGIYNSFARMWNGIEVSMNVPDNPVTKALKISNVGFTLGTPDLPLLASGAYVTRATLAVVGEGHGGEFVAPEAMLRRAIREETGGTAVYLTVSVPPTANPAETGRAVANSLKAYFRAGGRLVLPT